MLRPEDKQEKYLPRRIRCSRSIGNLGLYDINYEKRQRDRIFILNVLIHHYF